MPSDDHARKKRKKAKKPLIGVICLLTRGVLIRVRRRFDRDMALSPRGAARLIASSAG